MATHPVTHPSASALQDFALGKLNDSSAAALASHLDSCPDCCKLVAALSGDDFLNRLRQARGSSSTPAPAKMMADLSRAAKPPASRTPVPNLPPELAANQQYEILRELGRGGMGVVYLAKNKLMDRLEVLKVVNKALLDHPGAVERFLREIRSAAKLSHANVVAAYHALQDGELLAFAMEYVEGQDLASLVKSQGQLPIPHACFYVQQAAWGLQHAFEKGMIHRDIKPQNLMLAREGKKHIVKVLDFGLAKATREKKDDTGLTGEGKMLGTPDYIAPEQTLDAAKADIRADIYSLGCTLYYLLSGHPPFSASSLGAMLLAHQMHEAKPLNLDRPEVPEELAAAVRKMMAKSPAKRYQTPLEVVQALSPFVKQGATPKPSPELSLGKREAKPAVKIAARVDPPPAPAAQVPKPPQPAKVWESLAESSAASAGLRKSAIVRKPRAATVREGRSQKKWLLGGGCAAGALLLALFGIWATGVKPGTHKIVPTSDGIEVIGEDVEIAGGGQPKPIPNHDQERQLKDLMVGGSVWKGKYNNTENALVYLYVQHGNGSTFNAVHALHSFGNGTRKSILRNVRGNVKGNSLDYQPEGSDIFRVSGMWKSGCLEITNHRRMNGAESTAILKLEEARPESASCVLSVFHRNDAEGWYTLDQNGKKGATEPIEVRSVGPPGDNYHWLIACCIGSNPNEWGWHAPHKYHGNHSGKFGRCLMYSISCGETGKTPATHWYVRLQGAGRTLFLDGAALEPPASGWDWKTYCVRLDASEGWKHPGGKRATDEEIKKVLADVTDLRIRGEYGAKSDGCLADVEFGADDPFNRN